MGKGLIAALLLALLLPAVPAFGAEVDPQTGALAEAYDFAHQPLDQIVDQFRAEYGLDETNFSMSYYATGTGERYDFASEVYRTAASIYKLPLNMVYYEKRAAGQLSGDSTIDGYALDYMQEQSIVWSNNELSEAMLYHVVDGSSANSFREYRDYMTRYCEQDYPAEYYSGNNINTNYMMAVLRRLYDEPSGIYDELLEDLQIAMPDAYFRRYVTEYPIAHKYGTMDAAINDVGVIYTPEPCLLAAMTEGAAYGEEVLGRLCALMTAYTVWQTAAAEQAEAQTAAEQAQQADAAPQAAEPPQTVPEAVPEPAPAADETPALRLPWWWRFAAICIAVVLSAAAAITALAIQTKRAEEDAE